MFEIILSSNSQKFYQNCNSQLAGKLNGAFDDLSIQPFYGKNIKKLKGSFEGLYRYRVRDYRIVYSIEKEIRIVSIVWIGNRKEINKKK